MEIRLLGPLEVAADDGAPLTVSGPVLRSVLAALALRAGQALSADELTAQVWDTAGTGRPGATLRNHIARLRKILPEERIATVSGGYLLRAGPEETDLGRFRELRRRSGELAKEAPAEALRLLEEALALWRGTPLAGVGSSALRDREQARLLDLRLTVLEESYALRLDLGEQGRIPALPGELRDLVAGHPRRVRLAGQLVLALHRSGQTTQARQELRAAVTRLGESAGELRLLERELSPSAQAQAPARLTGRLDRLASAPEVVARLAASVFPLLGIADVREYNSGSVAALAGCTPREAAQALERLAAAGLIATSRPGGYALSPEESALAARLAAALPEPRRRAHLAGLACWYLGSLHRVNAPLALPGHLRARYHEGADRFPQGRLFTSADESLPWADQARDELLLLAQQLSEPEYDSGTELAGRPLSSFALEAIRARESYCVLRHSWRIQRLLSETALRVARRSADQFAEAVALYQLGRMYSIKKEGLAGLGALERAAGLFRTLGQEREAVQARSVMVPCLGYAGRLEEAVALAELALEEAQRAGLDELAIDIRHNMARSHLLLGHLGRAHRLMTEGYALARLPYNRMLSAGVLAEYYLKTEDYEKAAHWAGRALGHAAEQPFDPYMVAKHRTRRAAALRGLGMNAQARVEEMQAQALLEDINRREQSQLKVRSVGEEPQDLDAAVKH